MKISGWMAATALLVLAGCGEKTKAPLPTINDSMTKIMEPMAEDIWDTVSKAYNDRGDALDGTKLSEADWKRIADSSAKLKERAELIANAEHLVVAASNEPILGSQAVGTKGNIGADWDAVSAGTIQKRIDAKPELFSQKAKILVDSADQMNRAALTKDTVLLYKVASNLDEVCDGCHEPFWGTDEPPPFPKN